MDEERSSYPYHGYTITTLQEDGVWWARARVAEKDAGGDRPVLGGPWRNKVEAKTAAQAFCDRGKAAELRAQAARHSRDPGQDG